MKGKMRTREKVTLGALLGVLTLLAIGGVMAAVSNDSQDKAATYGQGYGPRDGSGYGRGNMMRGFPNNGVEGCPMHEALEAQGLSAEEFAELHKEMLESGKMGPGAMREFLESKGIDTSDFPQAGWRVQ